MFCPQCKAEYRPGFTRCSDCDVDLVYEPPPAARGLGATGEDGLHTEDSDDPFCSFWQGDDPRIHAELCELLNEEGILHKTVRREDHLFNLNTKSTFEVGIPFSQFEKAEAAIKNAYGTEDEQQDAGRLLPYGRGYAAELDTAFPWQPALKGFARTQDSQSERLEKLSEPVSEGPVTGDQLEDRQPNWDPADWSLADATLMIWSSEQSYPREIIEMGLRENQIHARFEKANGSNAIYVMPDDEVRAREIVREVVEGAPPE